jgi:hypothetical protein
MAVTLCLQAVRRYRRYGKARSAVMAAVVDAEQRGEIGADGVLPPCCFARGVTSRAGTKTHLCVCVCV